ncbi:MAG: 5'-nucleotidase C-terminal domain-containing protein [Sphingobacterium sp.]|uniref:5'-nucleotidase C-terminal domain-containing protein n=1 Tax=Sphingobacterium sp. JB170 TaxID=1434842 RepID=UPI00211B0330|nr:5'-nucleotidase [Sphingobacterium sp. JB170]
MKCSWHIAILLISLSIVSCKTQLHPDISKVQYYQIDSTMASDTAIVNYYSPFKKQLEEEMDRVIGVTDVSLTKNRGAESLAGNFFVDALLWKGKQLDPEVSVSFATKGGIRAEISKGDITVGNIFEMMPFENAITILTVTGADLQRWADYMASMDGQPAGGINLVIQNQKVISFQVNGKPVNPQGTYKMVTYDYLANGGDYITFLDSVLARKDYPQRVRETLIEYVSLLTNQGKHIQTKLDGRIRTAN